MSEIGIIEVKVKTKRGKLLATLTRSNGTLAIDGALNIAAEALALLGEHSKALPFIPKPTTESEAAR